ncbi:uncharacterized protein BKCO1_9800010 [Diplodia corticola]|uniref:Uncharacterized protein n=1 Tax=Diplodia corticola TaxID=236234 RepID=A0A1J9QLR8_9PEZI|nr:uncharacterized protein BKCO1_9800010 [Diplodia corticola]OJD29010.1 hypothetical protein BKCO1_9800010 [Diplodia corticola]
MSQPAIEPTIPQPGGDANVSPPVVSQDEDPLLIARHIHRTAHRPQPFLARSCWPSLAQFFAIDHLIGVNNSAHIVFLVVRQAKPEQPQAQPQLQDQHAMPTSEASTVPAVVLPTSNPAVASALNNDTDITPSFRPLPFPEQRMVWVQTSVWTTFNDALRELRETLMRMIHQEPVFNFQHRPMSLENHEGSEAQPAVDGKEEGSDAEQVAKSKRARCDSSDEVQSMTFEDKKHKNK